MIKLVCIDIDSTLLNDKREITPAVKEAINTATKNGVKIVITTGRPITGVRDILKELNIAGSDQYVITYNGGLVMSVDESEIIGTNLVDYEHYQKIEEFAQAENVYLQVETMNAAHTTNHVVDYYGSFENSLVNLPLYVHEKGQMPKDLEMIKAMITTDAKVIDQVIEKLPTDLTDRLNIIKSTPFNLEFINKNTSKGSGLLMLADKLGIDISETMAIGDQMNDYSMISAAGVGVAMGNAIDEIKDIAQYVTLDNNESGVAKAINELVL